MQRPGGQRLHQFTRFNHRFDMGNEMCERHNTKASSIPNCRRVEVRLREATKLKDLALRHAIAIVD